MPPSFHALKLMNDRRIERFPNSSFFTFAAHELKEIEERWRLSGLFDRTFYNELGIGLMCARELEQADPEFCAKVYEMLEEIRANIV